MLLALAILSILVIGSAIWFPVATMPVFVLVWLAHMARKATSEKRGLGPSRTPRVLIHDTALLFSGGVLAAYVVVQLLTGFEDPLMIDSQQFLSLPAVSVLLLTLTSLLTPSQGTRRHPEADPT